MKPGGVIDRDNYMVLINISPGIFFFSNSFSVGYKKLNELGNITLKMYDVEDAVEGFHTKGYIFKKEEIYRLIIGGDIYES